MNLYEHTIIARQDTSPSELKQLTEKYSKIVEKNDGEVVKTENWGFCLLYTSPSPRDRSVSRMPSSA